MSSLLRPLALLFLWLSLAGAAPVFSQTITLTTSHTPPLVTPNGDGYEDQIIREAFKRIGRDVHILRTSSARSLADASDGVVDGNFSRVPDLENKFPNLIMVPERLVDFEFTLFSKDPTLSIRSWSDLAPYNVALVSGWIIVENNVGAAKSVARVKDGRALFAFLDDDRADLGIFDHIQGGWLLKELGVTEVKPLASPLLVRGMHLYLHKRHEELVPALTAALRGMREEGYTPSNFPSPKGFYVTP